MFILDRKIPFGTFNFYRKASSKVPRTDQWFKPYYVPFEDRRYVTSELGHSSVMYDSTEASYNYICLHYYCYVWHGTSWGGGNREHCYEIYDRMEFDPSGTIIDDYGEVVGWNRMSDGALVMASACALADDESWKAGVQDGALGTYSLGGAQYSMDVLSLSDYRKYVKGTGGEGDWGIQDAVTTDGTIAKPGKWVTRWDQEGNARRRWDMPEAYVESLSDTGVSTDEFEMKKDSLNLTVSWPCMIPYRYVLKPTGTPPLITPESADLGRLWDPTSFSVDIATSATLTVKIDGELTLTRQVPAGNATIDLTDVWDSLAIGKHVVTITAENSAGYKCGAQRTFIKSYSGVVEDDERTGASAKFIAFSRWNVQLGEIQDVVSATHRCEVNGEDSLEIECLTTLLTKGDRILWHDGDMWREHVVNEVEQDHDGYQKFSYYCESAMMWDLRHKRVGEGETTGTPQQVLEKLLEDTVWTVGTVDIYDSKHGTFNRDTCYGRLLQYAGLYQGELFPTVECDVAGVATRKVNMVARMGSDNGVRFEYGHDLDGVKRSILADDVYTCVYAIGATKEDDEGNESIVTAYVEDNEAKLLWGLSDGEGGIRHAEGFYENSDCESAAELESEAGAFLSERSTPQVSYETSMPTAPLKRVRIGDVVHVVDREFTPELRLLARVGSLARDVLLKRATSVTFGTVVSVLPDLLARQYDAVKVVKGLASSAASVATSAASVANDASAAVSAITPASMMSGMNNVYEDGGSYVCQTASGGIITASVPMDSDGNPTVTTGALSAVRMSGGKLMKASSVDSTGAWSWSDVAL